MLYKIKTKITLLTLLSILLLGVFSIIIQTIQLNKTNKKDLISLETSIKHDYDLKIKEEVKITVSLIDAIYKKYQAGEYSFEESQQIAADLVRNLSYGNDSYFWIDTKEGLCIVYKGLPIEGTNRYDQKDANGKYLFHEINANACKPDGGYTDYWFPRPGETKAYPKRSYSFYFEPYNWVIGTGNYIDDINTVIEAKRQENLKELKKIILLTSLIVFFVIIIFGIIAYYIGASLSKPISKTVKAMKRISGKDINFKIEEKRNDEYGELYISINEITNNFKEIISNINASASSFMEASRQLTNISLQISESSNQQAATTEEISSSIEEMLATIQSNTEKSENTSKISTNAATKMKTNKEMIVETLSSVANISKQITIISEIADKTDILSINAAIEAARAGDAGRGFAVVAQEIRKLADKTQHSAIEINNLSEENIEISQISSEQLEIIIPQLIESAEQINNIAIANKEQENNVSSINNAVIQLTETTNENSASAEEMSASAEELLSQAEQLKQLIEIFKI